MIASLVINAIRSVLNAPGRSDSSLFYQYQKMPLKNLELFVLCARKLGDEAQLRFDDDKVSTLGSLFQRIHDALPRATPSNWDSYIISVNFRDTIANFKKEICHWYDTFSVLLRQPTFDYVMEIIDSVLENLCVIFHGRSWFENSSLHHIETMIEKITFLRNFICFATLRSVEPQQLLDNLLVQIQAVALDAAHTCYMYILQRDDVRPNIPVLLQMSKMVDPQVDEICTKVLISSKLSTQLLSPIPDKDHDPSVIMKDFIEFLLRNLCERLHTNTRIVISTNSELPLVYEGLRLLRIMLKEQPNKFDKKIGELTRVAICDAGVIIFSLYKKDMEIFVPASDLLQMVKVKDFSILDLQQRISRIRQRGEGKDLLTPDLLRRIHGVMEQVGENDLPRTNELGFMTSNPVPSHNRAPVADEIVGFDDLITSIVNRLTRVSRGSSQLKMVAIVGMPGIGKTTLATKVFNHSSVTLDFRVRLQCCVSQLFHKKQLLLELLKPLVPNTNLEMSEEEDLTRKLWQRLKGKRYLIFLDDVWDIEAWYSLEKSFPRESYGSRIIVTSRHRDAVPKEIPNDDIFYPCLLTVDQSLELLQKKLPPTMEWSPALDELGKQIAANCKGLPLTVVVVAGLLANMEPQGWKIFLESISSFSAVNHCMKILELSYKHLPGHLKECFLYFGLFPEDHEVPVRRLIQLWIAEGFVRKTESIRLEDAAKDYLMDLVRRSLVIVSKERSIGGVKTCRIHDLLHDFCRTKAKDENSFQLLKGNDDDEFLTLPVPAYIRRLCVHSKNMHCKSLRLFCPLLHSLLFFPHHKQGCDDYDISFIIARYSRFRVLDIGRYHISSQIGIPSEIGLVLQLQYLSVSGHISHIPSCIGSLTNLETFILHSSIIGNVSVPDTFWNLQKLRHVEISYGFHLPFENPEKIPELCELQSCSHAIIHHEECIEWLVRKFPNIRKLRCELNSKDSNEIETLKFDSLSQLESLHLKVMSWPRPTGLEFDFPRNLRKLILTYVLLRESDVSKIGKLPNLEVVKFVGVNFHDDTWEMVLEGEFSTLRFLELSLSRIVRWTAASDDQFPYLEKLALISCLDLEEIPCCFQSMDTLEMVQVRNCSDYAKSFFKGIKDQQEELGNLLPKIQISNSGGEEDFEDE